MITIINNNNGGWQLTTVLPLTSIIAFCMILSGCRSTEYIPVKEKDSVRIETRHTILTEKDTVFVNIPKQTAERTATDSTSHLENDFAVSDVHMNANGTLFHTLRTKTQNRPVPVDKVIELKDTTIYVDKTVEVPVLVEKELGWWEKTCIACLPYSLGIIAVLTYIIAWLVRRHRN